jgi:hypothetical protein
MKKMFLLAVIAAGAAFIGCQRSVDGEDLANSRRIDFRTLTEKTRATVVDGNNISSFKVSAIWNDPASAVPTSFNHMDGTNVIRNMNGASTWTYSPVKYWPDAGTVDFYAYSPAGSVNVSDFTSSSPSNAVITYTVPLTSTEAKTAEDLLVSVSKDNTYVSAVGVVQLTFDHALSHVTFSAKNLSSGATYTIYDLELMNLVQTGTLNLAAAAPSWTLDANASNTYAASLPEIGVSVLPNTTDFKKLLGLNEGVMIMPQAVTKGDDADTDDDGIPDDIADNGKGYVRVTYGATDQAGGVIRPVGTEEYFPLEFTFESKKAYEIQITFNDTATGLNPISFAVTGVTAWPTPTPVPVPAP